MYVCNYAKGDLTFRYRLKSDDFIFYRVASVDITRRIIRTIQGK